MLKANGKTYLTTKEVAERTLLKIHSVRQKYKEFGWTPYLFGKHKLFEEDQIQEWIDNRIRLVEEEVA